MSAPTAQLPDARRSNPSASRHCFVLSWPFELTGGVNQVVQNLILEFQKDQRTFGEPLALQLAEQQKPDDMLDSGIRRMYLHLRSPYVRKKAFLSAAGFLLHLPAALSRLRWLCRANQISVLNMHYPDLEALNLVLLKLLGLFNGQVILSLHGSDIRSAMQERGMTRRIWRFMLRHASTVVTCSDGLRQEALQFEPRANVITIYNGIDVDRFSAQADPLFRWPTGLDGKRIVVNVAQFEFRKGHDILLSAFRKVRSTHEDVALVLAGSPGPTSSAVENMIRDLALSDSVFCLGVLPHEKIYDLLKHATVFALATRWRHGVMGEGFAIALLEAAAAKLPVVATASCGVAEIIHNGETGRIVPLEDDAALAAAISEMLDNPEQAQVVGENLHALVRKQFTWRSAAEKYLALKFTGH